MAIYKSNKPTKDGRQYFFRIKYKDIFGNVKDYTSPKFFSMKEANIEEAKYKIKIANFDTKTTTTLNKIFNEYIIIKKDELKPQSIVKLENRFKYLVPIADKNIDSINSTDIHKLKLLIKDSNLSIAYSNKILELLRTLFRFSKKYYNTSDKIVEYIDNFKNPGLIKKEMDFYTIDEYQQFRNNIENIEWKTFFDVLYYMGLRQGEVQALTWNDISNSQLKITKTLTSKIKGLNYNISSPKTKNSIRTLPIPKVVKNGLETVKKQYQNEYSDFNNNWFIFGGKYPFKESTIFANKNKFCEKANLRRIRIHDFRHSCASMLINKGASIVLVSKYLGHSNITITLNTYTHLYKNELEDITKMIDNI